MGNHNGLLIQRILRVYCRQMNTFLVPSYPLICRHSSKKPSTNHPSKKKWSARFAPVIPSWVASPTRMRSIVKVVKKVKTRRNSQKLKRRKKNRLVKFNHARSKRQNETRKINHRMKSTMPKGIWPRRQL